MTSDYRERAYQLLKAFVSPGQLCFDVGANKGEYTAALRDLGGKVVAVEPQQECLKILHEKFDTDADVIIEPVALGMTKGTMKLSKVRGYPQIASLSPDWMARGPFAGGFKNAEYEVVTVTTLDDLISRHGLPVFCKIDVEEYEGEVLSGLSQFIATVSFEYHRAFLDKVKLCINRLETLGSPKYNYSPQETMHWESDTWVDGPTLMERLSTITDDELGWGDIYVKFS